MAHPIHHITAIASDPKKCIDFYTKILGLRLVKKTVNQDQTEAYHLFFGDKTGEPGMDLTFFTFPGIGMGKRGPGAVSTISLSVPQSSIDFWHNRFDTLNVKHDGIVEKYNSQTITFYDHDDQRLELVGIDEKKTDNTNIWETDEIAKKNAIRSFHSAKLSVFSKKTIEAIITKILGFENIEKHDSVSLFGIKNKQRASHLEIEEHPNESPVINASGTVHHIAFQVADKKELIKKRQDVLSMGLYPTDVIDRYYFKSIYFRTPAGILFELATNGPGFTIDEAEEILGKKLSLPPFLEHRREEIEKYLTPIE